MTTSTPHHLIEQTRNRNSRAILKGDTIVIRLAKNLSKAEEKRHIDALLMRMIKAKARNVRRALIDPFRSVLDGAETLSIQGVLGPPLQLEIQEGKTLKKTQHENTWHILRPKDVDLKRFHRFLWNIFSQHCSPYADEYVRLANIHTLGARIQSVDLKFMRSRWGSCSYQGVIALSAPLLCTTEAILRYVTIHELCHTRHADHSSRFWHTVEQYEPLYRQAVQELKMLRLPSC